MTKADLSFEVDTVLGAACEGLMQPAEFLALLGLRHISEHSSVAEVRRLALAECTRVERELMARVDERRAAKAAANG